MKEWKLASVSQQVAHMKEAFSAKVVLELIGIIEAQIQSSDI